MCFATSREGPNLGNRLGTRVKPRTFRKGKIVYSRYLDDMDRESGKNYDMRRGKKNVTDTHLEGPVPLIDKVQNAFESTPVPFCNIISQEYW